MRASKAASNPSRPWVAPVEWASCVELASCQFQYIVGRAGCPLYSYSLLDSETPRIQEY
ncbi:MAG: hypothetical protein F6K44_20145 [Moorea sp. SIO3E2]|uniref:hypothetical protein n=1 Tax=Moorena sp. SIO4E2 TaxID=2607826 RepID=UPI0013B5D4EF|nr:hypothetical protein [Moorena sp. SIO4E2]NEQ08229.1 hypothetical protein [Moorena sp. SIO4E2]NEQ15989.1 hypothetical protein [Moorena sp. SIO3E2]